MKMKILRMLVALSMALTLCVPLCARAESLGTLDFEDDFSETDLANWDAPTGRYRVFEVVDGRLNAKATSDNSSAARIKGKTYDDFNMTFNFKTSFGSDYSSYFKVELWDSENKNDFLMFKKNKIAFYNGSAQQDLKQYDIEDDTIYDVKIEAGSEISVYIKKQDETDYTYIGATEGLRIPSSRSVVFGQQGVKISIDDVCVYIPGEEEPDIPDIPEVPVPDPNNGEWALDFEDDFALTDLANWDAPTGRYRVFEVVDGRLSAKANSDNSSAARIKDKIYDDFLLTFNFKADYSANASYAKVELWNSETNLNDWLIFRTDRITHYNGNTETKLSDYSIASNTEYDVLIKATDEAEIYIKKHDEENYTYIGKTSGLRIPSSRNIVFGQKDLKVSVDDVYVYTPKEKEPDIPDIPEVPVPDPNNGEWTLNFEDDFTLTDLANWDAPTGRYRVFEVVDGRLSAKATSDNSSAARIKNKIYDDFLLTFNFKTDYSVNGSYAKVELWNSETNLNDWLIFRTDRITHYNGNTETKLSDYSITSNTEYDVLIKATDEAEIYIKKHDEENYTYIGKTSGLRIPSSRNIVFGQKDLKVSIDDVKVYIPYAPPAAEFAGSSPADGTVEVDVASKVELNFTAAIDESTLNAATVLVSGSSNIPSYTVSKISDTKYEVSFDAPLEYMTTYTVSLSNGIKDTNGSAIEAAEISFTTEGADEWNLQFSDDFSSTDLANWDAPTGRYRVFEVIDGRMTAKANSDNSSAARIKDRKWDGFKLEFNVSTKYTSNEYFKVELWDEQNNSDWLMFRSDRITYYNGQGETLIGNYSINSDTVYDVKIIALGDTASIYIKPHTERGYTFVGTSPAMKITENRDIVFGQTNLKISVDDVKVYTIDAPELVSHTPADQAQDVAVDTEIRLSFNKNIDMSTINSDTVIISDGTENVQFTVTKLSNSEYGLKPLSKLSYFSRYTVSITKGVKDEYGQGAEESAFTFRTEEQPPEIDVLENKFEIISESGSKPVTALENGKLRGSVIIRNNTASEKRIAVILALYRVDSNGIRTMEDIVVQESMLAAANDGQMASVDINVPNSAGHSVGLFLWDGLDTMVPIAPYAELN